PVNPRFQFSTIAGRYVVLCFFASAAEPASRRVLDDILQHRARFDDETCCFFGVSTDPGDEQEERVKEIRPGIHLFWDFDRRISRLFGALEQTTSQEAAQSPYRRFTLVLDERLRVIAGLP